jgi:LysR family transcriptional regulator, glycine cleavage system transcriptional activator
LTKSKSRIPPLLAIRAFEAAARHLSFTVAAEELAVTQGAISRQIRQLESHLQTKLFVRLTRRVELTEAGREFLAGVQRALSELEAATARISGAVDHRVINVAVLPTLAANWLMPRLAFFSQEYPHIEVRMLTSIEPVDLQANPVDLAIRVGPLPGKFYDQNRPRIDLEMVSNWRGVLAELLFPDVLVPICSPAYLKDAPALKEPGDLQHHRLIHTATRRHAWPDWLRAHGHEFVLPPQPLQFGHFFMSMQAAREGKGIAIVPTVVVDHYPHANELVRPFPASVPSAGEYYLLVHERRRDDPSVRLFSEWLLKTVRGDHQRPV